MNERIVSINHYNSAPNRYPKEEGWELVQDDEVVVKRWNYRVLNIALIVSLSIGVLNGCLRVYGWLI